MLVAEDVLDSLELFVVVLGVKGALEVVDLLVHLRADFLSVKAHTKGNIILQLVLQAVNLLTRNSSAAGFAMEIVLTMDNRVNMVINLSNLRLDH